LEQGYEVFTNVSLFGPVDLVAIKDYVPILIDVKGTKDLAILTPEQTKLGVKFLYGPPFQFVDPKICVEVFCQQCGKLILKPRSNRKWCSETCRNANSRQTYLERHRAG
jgi:hypothetical protein